MHKNRKQKTEDRIQTAGSVEQAAYSVVRPREEPVIWINAKFFSDSAFIDKLDNMDNLTKMFIG